jgi:predicted dehydrogenase
MPERMQTHPEAGKIRCAVIGYGGAYNMGKAHLSQMADAGMQPAAVAELDPSRLEVARADFPGIQTFTTVADMLAQARPDLVAIITPHNSHAPLAIACLEGGAAVVCEKPMALTVEECDRMIAAARANDRLLSVYHNRHWDGCVLEAVERIRARGEIGEVFRVEAHMGGFGNPGDAWRSSRSISGGIHYDWGVHLAEYALQVIDSEAVEVSGFLKAGVWSTHWGADTNEDEVSAIVRFANGTLLNLRITHLDANPSPHHVVFTGTAGKYHMNQRDFEIHRKADGLTRIVKGPNRPGEQDQYYRNIADALTGRAPLAITPEWSRRTIQILELASRSAREGRSLPV